MEEAFMLDARGWCVANLQQALRIRADGRFGPSTYEAVARIERELQREIQGRADASVFAHVGLPWPSEFERVLALVMELEGTSFGDCNSTDIDGAGLTMGICGFTTRHGEVQALVETFLSRVPEAWAWLPTSMQLALRKLMDAHASPAQWEEVLLDSNRRPRPATRAAIAAWGQHPFMRELQRSWAEQRFWQPAVKAARELDVDVPAGRALLFDVWVQNGGWRPAHAVRMQRHLGEPSDVRARLHAIALAVAGEARAPWRADVLSRKLLFARGAGMVHGVFYSLAAQAIIPS
jgi:peptidoglycan hydrolase-like protein with peptidoglycan-binding domain